MKRKNVISLVLAVILLISLLTACGSNVSFKIDFIVDGDVYHTVDSKGNEEIQLPADPEKEGYIFDGWYWDKDTWEKPFTANSILDAPLSENMSVYAKWKTEGENEVQTYTITFNSNGGGDVSAITKEAGESITEPTAPTKTGYTFDGWYTDNNTFQNEYTFSTMPAESFTLYAKWIEDEPQPIEYTISFDSNSGSSVTAITKEAGESITEPTAPTKTGYTFDGWYTDNNIFIDKYIFNTMPEESFTLYAKWIEDEPQAQTEYTRINASGEPAVDGDYIWFGEYPQTIKANDVTITETIDGRGYYLGSDGYYYAKVTATPRSSGYTFSTSATVSSGTVYYFKVEPIKWRILSEENGTALILCESIIANKRYDEDSNNYMNSEIRAWLNGEFYNKAFNVLQQELIQTTNVDNSVYSTGYDPNPYVCDNTNDKIFLPSYREMVNTSYGFSNSNDTARRRLTSDYSRATGAYMNTDTAYYGNGSWWLRSPYNSDCDYARYVDFDGTVTDGYVDYTNFGVVPALKIRLSTPQPVTYTITFNSYGGGDISAITKEAGESITEPTTPTKAGYTFDGWYTDDDTFLDEYTFSTMPAESFTLYAKWIEDEPQAQTEYTRINASGEPAVDGDYILFGEYPQTIKANEVTVGTSADTRGYYLGSDGYYYAKVTATPYNSGYTFSTSATVSSGTVYYFKVEPIKWRILSEENGTALILCESIIANKGYNEYYEGTKNGVYANNYKESEIRAWLNNEFYNTAFNTLQQELIQITNVDNSVYSTGYSSNPYTCENTNDKIFLPSYREMVNTAYGFSSNSSDYDTARRRLTSDYSRATGAYMNTDTSYYGNGYWWLRSPYYNDSYYARSVDYYGRIYYDRLVDRTYSGVVPALVIDLR